MTMRVPSLYLAGVAFVAGVGSAGLLMSPAPKQPSAEKGAVLPAPPATPIQAASAVDPACRDAAWPYTSGGCSAAGPDRPVRQVRVIPTGREPRPSIAVAAAMPAPVPDAAAPAAPATRVAPVTPVSARPSEPVREPAVTGSVLTNRTDAGPPAPVAMLPASLGRLDEKSSIEPVLARADARPNTNRPVAEPAPASATLRASAALALNEARALLRGTGAEAGAKPVPPVSEASLAPAQRSGPVTRPVSDLMSLTSLQPNGPSPASVLPIASPQPATTRIVASAQEVRPVEPEGDRGLDAGRPERVAETAPPPATPERVAERSFEPAAPASRELARGPQTSPAPRIISSPLPRPAERSVATAQANPAPLAPLAMERQEPRADRKATRPRGEPERLAARPERATTARRAEAPRSRQASGPVREANRVAEAPNGRPLQVLRLRVYDYPDGTRIAVNPRTGETYTGGQSRRAEPSSGSLMSWLAGESD